MTDYDPQSIEPKWQRIWEERKTFRNSGATQGKKFYCLDMFPYPSGSGLHVGHPLGYTATDILCRYKRMNGFSVLHPMGFDAFGLPAEQHAIATGEHPAAITIENCQRFTDQLKLVGLSFDWDRMVRTCDPQYYKVTQWIFVQIFNSWFDEKENRARPISELPIPAEVSARGAKAVADYQADFRLAYYTDAMVNWCPALGTVLANEEVIDGRSERGGHDVIRKPMKQWMLRITKYSERLLSELEGIDWPASIKEQQRNWIGQKRGAHIEFPVHGLDETVTAFTTRPDTLFGVTFFVLAPEHPLVQRITSSECRERVTKYCDDAARMSELERTIDSRKKTGVFTGGYVVNPITREMVPVYVGDYVLSSVGTGAVMGVPAHDDRDFEFARTFQIDIQPVVQPPAGTDPEIMRAVCEGEIAWTEAGVMLPCEKSVAVELGLAGIPNTEAAKKIVGWLTKNQFGKEAITYKLRDWLFSRQRYWGEPIPVVHWDDGTMSSLSESELPLVLPEVAEYKPAETGESPLARAGAWLEVVDAKSGKRGRRETNTMPQWAGSCWYYLRFIDPTNEAVGWDPTLEKNWMPVDLYVGGAEHAVLHLLYARFWHKILFDLGHVSTREPFQKLYNQGMMIAHAYKDQRGALVPIDEVEERDDGKAYHRVKGEELERVMAKMSKSLRNVITLDDTVKRYGADTFRMYLMFMGPLDLTRVWDSKAITGNHRFLRRVWNFVTAGAESGIRKTVDVGSEPDEARRALHKLMKKVGEDIEGLKLNTAIAAMMEYLNTVGDLPVSRETLQSFILIVSPFAPHLGEELWERLGNKESLAYASWPTYDPALIQDDLVTVVVQLNGKKKETISVSRNVDEGDLRVAVTNALARTNAGISETTRFITVYQSGTKVPKLVNVIV